MPTGAADLAAGLFAILRECESINAVWGKPDLPALRRRLIAVVTTLRADINVGNTRECQEAIEDLSQSLHEMEDTDVPANYIVRLRAEQSSLRKALLRVYHLQREEFLPSAYAMIVSLIVVILAVVMFTNFEDLPVSVVTLAFLAFFFLYLLQLLNVINKPFKVGRERSDDDVSLLLLAEFVVHAQAGDEGVAADDIEAQAAEVEEEMAEAEHEVAEAAAVAEAIAAEEEAEAEQPLTPRRRLDRTGSGKWAIGGSEPCPWSPVGRVRRGVGRRCAAGWCLVWVLLSTNMPSTVATKSVASSSATSGSTPAVVRWVRAASIQEPKAAPLPGGVVRWCWRPRERWFRWGTGSMKPLCSRTAAAAVKKSMYAAGGSSASATMASNSSRYTSAVVSMTATARASLPPGKKW